MEMLKSSASCPTGTVLSLAKASHCSKNLHSISQLESKAAAQFSTKSKEKLIDLKQKN